MPLIGGQILGQNGVWTTQAISCAGTGVTNVVNVSGETGQLIFVSITDPNSLAGTPTINLEIQVDGGATVSIPLFEAGISFSNKLAGFFVNTGTGGMDCYGLQFNQPYRTSIRVGLNVSVAASSGSVTVSVYRGKN